MALAVIPFLLGHESSQGHWKLAANVSTVLSSLKGKALAIMLLQDVLPELSYRS